MGSFGNTSRIVDADEINKAIKIIQNAQYGEKIYTQKDFSFLDFEKSISLINKIDNILIERSNRNIYSRFLKMKKGDYELSIGVKKIMSDGELLDMLSL